MITAGILYIIFGFIYAVTSPLRLLSDVTLDANILSGISTAADYLKIADFVLPVSSLAAIIGLFMTIELSILTYRLIMWTIKKIPGVG